MATAHVLVVGLGSLVTGLLFTMVALDLLRRPYPRDVRVAAVAFAIAWAAFAFAALNDAGRIALVLTLDRPEWLYFTLARLKIVAAAIAICGFSTYVAYLWTGNVRAWLLPLLLFALAHAFLFLYLVEVRDPVSVELGKWAPRMQFREEAALPAGLAPFGLLFFFLPPIVLSVLYLTMSGRLHTRTHRYRVILVALSIGLFHVANMFQSNPDVSASSDLWLGITAAHLVAGLLAYLAYRPPAWLRQRLHVTRLGEEDAEVQAVTDTGPDRPAD